MQDLQQQKWQYLQEKEKSFTERPVPILAPITTRVAINSSIFRCNTPRDEEASIQQEP
ncbi:MAG: hypothetical protein ACK51L_00105 [bacterium]